MLEMAINNVEMGSELDRVHILTCCEFTIIQIKILNAGEREGICF